MYIESSKGSPKDEAIIISPQLPPTTRETCLVFWYHMHGENIGSLVVESWVSLSFTYLWHTLMCFSSP